MLYLQVADKKLYGNTKMTIQGYRHIILFFILIITAFQSEGQFYNGHQMTFGKNRVQYNNFYWSYYRYDNFDVYFNQNGKNLANYTADYLKKRISEMESILDYRLDKRIIFIVFNKLTDLRQTNIGLVTGQEETNLGGVTNILKNKVFVYFNGDHTEYENQMDAAIAQIILNEMLYGTDLKENVTNSTLINLPEWYLSGLISYISDDWNLEIENIVKDGILNKRFKKFYHLQNEEAVYAGHSFWKYIADTYGKSVIPDILYLTRIYKNPNYGFQYSIGFSVKELARDWVTYYRDYYSSQQDGFATNEKNPLLKRPKRKLVYHNMKINPTHDKLVYVTHKRSRFKLWMYDLNTGKKTKIFQHGHNIEQITDYTYPALAWHPSGKILTFITEEKGGLKLYFYNLEEKELVARNFLYFEKVLDYNFSHDGFKFVMSAVRNSQTDVFVYTLSSATTEQITNDIADDYTPRFINKSSSIIFSSNRQGTSLQASENVKTDVVHNLFIYNYSLGSQYLKKIETPEYSNSHEPYEVEGNKYIFLNDNNGIFNRYVATFDSTISHIDTTIHYRYVSNTSPLTNYFENIETHYYANNQLAESQYSDGKSFMFVEPASSFNLGNAVSLPKTKYRPFLSKELREKDSLNQIKVRIVPIDDIEDRKLIIDTGDTMTLETWPVDVNNYIFEKEKLNYYNEKLKGKNIRIVQDTLKEKRPLIRIYEKAFYPNYLVNQVDFQQTNTSYQVFTGGAVYFSPGMNMLFKVGTNDLFEDYRIIFGYRFTFDFESNEYLLSFENLKSRWDKQYIYHRQAFKNITENNQIFRIQSNEAMYIVKYPFNQVFAFNGTFKTRFDNGTHLSTDDNTLKSPNRYSVWLGAKEELVFDNTRSLGMNLYSGTRWKIFGESYFRADQQFSNLFVIGADYRYYLPIHRSLIWAFRFAASSSFGNNKLVYYLGSVDNWTNLTPRRIPTYDQSVPVDTTANYAFQTLATNMRGFSQNIRNGNNFALINTEVRWPIVRYIANRPVASNFLNHLQFIGFFDIGSAWHGFSPYSGENAYDLTVVGGGDNPVKITVKSNREPIVAGYGFGARTMLLGYFIRLDWAWGIESKAVLPRVMYLSLNLDF